jgi:dethiobiotin synthetase
VRPGPLLVGSWPAEPTPVHRANLARLREAAAGHGYAWGGAVPAGLGTAPPQDVHRAAARLGGVPA